jgi:hypothetical protein
MAIKVATKEKMLDGVTITFADKGATKLACELSKLSPEVVQWLAVHGLSQKVGDAYASSGGDVKQALESAKEVWDNLTKGILVARSSGGGLFVEALARIKKLTVEQAGEMIAKLDEERIEKLKANTQVKAMMTVIRGERAAVRAEAEDEVDLDLE